MQIKINDDNLTNEFNFFDDAKQYIEIRKRYDELKEDSVDENKPSCI